MRYGVFTNGAYDIIGVIICERVKGWVIRTDYPTVYEKGEFVDLPEYHLDEDKLMCKPQFTLKEEYESGLSKQVKECTHSWRYIDQSYKLPDIVECRKCGYEKPRRGNE